MGALWSALGRDRAPDLEELGHYAVAFSQDEWTALVLVGDGEKRFDHFRSLWACKEAYVKARGDASPST
ncbi:hypothetical protein SO694_000164132 [Aureococcus anophagefferens]|uniref:4'-phosphopantetheinyl transferase domain-containing protein n=1 Tax=Aureococcus anophagefferens TaxID=44056 RepID=A0ABR1G341_AURAN